MKSTSIPIANRIKNLLTVFKPTYNNQCRPLSRIVCKATHLCNIQSRGWPLITGCALAQHCYNGDVSIPMGKMETLTLCKIDTLEQIDTQFVRIDYVHEVNLCSKFGKNPFTGDFWAKGWNITFLCDFFIYLFIFSRTNLEKRPLDGFWGAMAQKTRNRARMCFLGVIKWKIQIRPLFTPKTPKIWPWIGNFQPI